MNPDTAATATLAGRRWLDQLIQDVAAVWRGSEPAVWSEDLVRRLAALRPTVYDGLDVGTFGRAMRSAGIGTVNIHRGIFTRRGVRLADLTTAVRSHGQVVYFAERHGFVKIGTTQNLPARIDAINSGDSAIAGMTITPVKLLALMPGGLAVEQSVHELFRSLRYDGEWFLFDEPLVSFVRSVAAAGGRP